MANIEVCLLNACLRSADALPALPVSIADPPHEALLLAATGGLTILSGGASGSEVTREDVDWTRVRLGAADMGLAPSGAESADPYHLAVVVEDRVYHTLLDGPERRAALRDFVVAARSGRRRGCTACPI